MPLAHSLHAEPISYNRCTSIPYRPRPPGGDRYVFETMWFADTIPTNTSQLPKNDVFKILNIDQLMVDDIGF